MDGMNTVFFDVETQRIFDEVRRPAEYPGPWPGRCRYLLHSRRHFCHYTEEKAADLIAELNAADLVVGFNVISFDYAVLRAYGPLNPGRTVDMLDQIYRRLGFRSASTVWPKPHWA